MSAAGLSIHRCSVPKGHRSGKKARNSVAQSNGGFSDLNDRVSCFSHVQREGEPDNPMLS